MEYYVAMAGEKVGPLSQFKLVEMLRDGDITPENKAWHKGLPSWLPIAEIPSLTSTVESLREKEIEDARLESVAEAAAAGVPEAKTELKQKNAPPKQAPPLPSTDPAPASAPPEVRIRPLSRFFGRSFDYTLIFVLVFFLSDVEIPKIDPDLTFGDLMNRSRELATSEEMIQLAKLQFFALMIWHVVEGILLSIFQTTPGKFLFGVKVTNASGGRLSLVKGIYRSFLVYILGVGLFYFSVITLLAMTFSFFRLMTTGTTLWDQWLHARVEHPPLTVWRVFLLIVAFAALMWLQYLKIS